jgi:hypothetical protein
MSHQTSLYSPLYRLFFRFIHFRRRFEFIFPFEETLVLTRVDAGRQIQIEKEREMGAAVFKFFLGTLGLTMNSKSLDRI